MKLIKLEINRFKSIFFIEINRIFNQILHIEIKKCNKKFVFYLLSNHSKIKYLHKFFFIQKLKMHSNFDSPIK